MLILNKFRRPLRTFESKIARKIPDLKLHKLVVGNVLDVQIVRAFEKECLVRRHLVENHALDTRLAAPNLV